MTCQLCGFEETRLIVDPDTHLEICEDCAREKAALGFCPSCAGTGEWEDLNRGVHVCACVEAPCQRK